MEYHPYKLLNATELSEIEKQVEAAYNKWASAWLAGDGTYDVDCCRAAEFDTALLPAKNNWMWIGVDSEQWLAIACSPALYRQLGDSLIPTGQSIGSIGGKSSALLSDLVKSALTDLLGLLGIGKTGSNAEKMEGTQTSTAQFWEVGSGATIAEVALGDEKLVVLISPRWVTAMLVGVGTKTSRKPSFTKPGDALSGGRLELKVLIGEAQLDLALLQTIVVGDVIKLNTRIDEPLHVVNADGVQFCKAFLGSREGRKSIQLTT